MKRVLSLALAALLLLLMPSFSSAEDLPVLTIGDARDRSGTAYNPELGMWKYLEEKLGMKIRHVYLSSEEYDLCLASGDLPDIVTTNNNLSTILECGAALDVDPYLEEYCPNFPAGIDEAEL